MSVSYLKKGAKAQKEMKKADAKAEAASKNTIFRFWMPNDTDTSITFLDGNLTEDGLLDIVMYYEHQVYLNGKWTNWFVCTSEDEPCPVCEGGDTPALVGALTVIDHSEYEDKQGKNHKHEKRLFVAKRQTIKQLQELATKRGGLAGCTFDVSRTGDKSASVGNMFDFTEKVPKAKLKKKYKDVSPFDYEEVIQYIPAKELRKIGFGSTMVGDNTDTPDDDDYDDDL